MAKAVTTRWLGDTHPLYRGMDRFCVGFSVCFCGLFRCLARFRVQSWPAPQRPQLTETGTDHRNGNRHRPQTQAQKPAPRQKRIFRAAATISKPTKHIGPDFRSSPSDCASEAAPGTASMHDLLRDMHQQIDDLIRVAPLVVVPGYDLHEIGVQCDTGARIENRCAGIR